MIEQIGTAIRFDAFFTASRQGATGLTVTVDVYDETGSKIVSDGNATEVGGGLYTYQLASGSVDAEGNYRAVFKTADTTVDFQHLPALWTVGVGGVENLDAAVSTRSSHSAADVWTSTTRTLTAFSTALAVSVWDVLTASIVTANSIGAHLLEKLALITTGTTLVVPSVVASSGDFSIVRGDDYDADDGRELEWSSEDWPDLTSNTALTLTARNPTDDTEVLTVTGSATATGAGSQTVRFELVASDTSGLTITRAPWEFDVQVTLASGNIVTLVRGYMTLLEDQTRA